MNAIRATHFDEKKVLGSILRNDDDLPDEIRKALRIHFGFDDKDKKKSSRKSDNFSEST